MKTEAKLRLVDIFVSITDLRQPGKVSHDLVGHLSFEPRSNSTYGPGAIQTAVSILKCNTVLQVTDFTRIDLERSFVVEASAWSMVELIGNGVEVALRELG